MSARSRPPTRPRAPQAKRPARPPTDGGLTDIYEAKDLPAQRAKPTTKKGVPEGARGSERPPRRPEPPPRPSEPPRLSEPPPRPSEPPPLPPAPRGEPRRQALKVISMKTPAGAGADKNKPEAREHKVSIRPLSEVVRRHDTPPGGFGHLAPPRDPKDVRARRLQDYVIWGSAVVIVGCAVMIGVWLLARS